MKVLVFGAAGSQQFPLIAALQSKGISVIANTHSQANVERLQAAGAEVVIADMADRDRIFEITKGVDAISFLAPFFLANPSDGFVYAKNVIDAAVTNGVSSLVWNTSGFILPFKIGNPSMDVRLDILEYLQKSGLSHVVIEPSVYIENLLGPWTAPFVKNQNVLLYPTPEDMCLGWIATKDVAALIAQAIVSTDLSGRRFRVSGLENVTGPELASQFSIALGKPISYRQMPPKEFGGILDQLFGPGAGIGAEKMYQELTDTKRYPEMCAAKMPEVLKALPVKMTSIQEWVKENQVAFL